MLTLKLLLLLCSGILSEHSLCKRSGSFKNGIGFKKLTEILAEKTKNIKTPADSIKWKTFEVAVDHFNKTDTRTWKMRYCERLDLHSQDGPIYVFIGGEGEMSDDFLKTTLVFDIAQETNGAIFATEHRYYGESLPLGPKTHDVPLIEYYKYLSSRQALADLADFVVYVKSQPRFLNSKLVMIGGSYAGNLAAWFRLLYPKLATAALASSAPVQAVVDFPEYFDTVTDVYRKIASQQCVNNINQTFQTIAQEYKTDEGIDRIKREFNICPECDVTGLRQYILLNHIINPYVDGIQSGFYDTIYHHCPKLPDREYLSSGCVILSLNEYYYPNSWSYQVCTEFGYLQTTDSVKQMFWGLPVQYYYQICKTTFGIEEEHVNRAIKETNEYYGGRNINVSKVLFVNGENDPWHNLGILESSKNYVAILTPNATHCEDIFAENKALAEKEKNILKKWIGM